MNIKHTVLMVTYNQVDYISKALDSILNQKVLPYEVFIGDDFSTDSTRDIILKYKKKYPNIIKPIFNEQNLGIYRNLNNVIRQEINGDIISFLAGDDWIEGEMFEKFNNIIVKQKLSCKKDTFMFMPNYYIFKNGQYTIINNFQFRGIDNISLSIRHLASNRSAGISRSLFNQLPKHDITVGPWADWLWDMECMLHCRKLIFINEAFPVYRIGVGINSHENGEYFNKSYLKTIYKICELYGKNLSIANKLFLYMQKCRIKYLLNNNLINYIKYLMMFFINIFNFKSYKELVKEIKHMIPGKIKKYIKYLINCTNFE